MAGDEVDAVVARRDPVGMVEGVVTGTIIGEALFNALRRMAQQPRRAAAHRGGARRPATPHAPSAHQICRNCPVVVRPGPGRLQVPGRYA